MTINTMYSSFIPKKLIQSYSFFMRFFYKKLDDDGAIVKNLLSKWTPVFEPLKKSS